LEQDEAVGGEDLADLEAGAVQRSSGEEVRGVVRPAELPRLGGAAPAGGTWGCAGGDDLPGAAPGNGDDRWSRGAGDDLPAGEQGSG